MFEQIMLCVDCDMDMQPYCMSCVEHLHSWGFEQESGHRMIKVKLVTGSFTSTTLACVGCTNDFEANGMP